MITVFQIQLTDEQINEVNEKGHESVPAQRAKLNVMFGADKFRYGDLKYYKETMQVDTDDLEEAFALTNLWNEPDRVARVGNAQSSTSVGDIFRKGDRYYMVDSFGFSPLMMFNDEIAILEGNLYA